MISESTVINSLAADIREVDGDHTLGAGALAEALVAKGWIQTEHIPLAIVETHVPQVFKNGDPVEVYVWGEWIPGTVTEVTPHGLTHVYTEDKGQRTVYTGGTALRKPLNS